MSWSGSPLTATMSAHLLDIKPIPRPLTGKGFNANLEVMKEIVVRIDDDAYRRVEGIANAREISLSALVEELVESVTSNAQPNADDINHLLDALDKGRNTEPIGRLGRQELHDRPVLHRY
jgi:predicted transcriptional regulator